MPLQFRLPGARLVRNRVVVLCFACLGALLAFCPWLGGFLSVEDPLLHADAIVVLSGSFAERPLEAWDLYRAGYAPVIVFTREAREGGQIELARRGTPLPDRADVARDLLQRLGVPPSALIVPDALHDSTADEARTIHDLARDRHWRRVLIVTSKFHTPSPLSRFDPGLFGKSGPPDLRDAYRMCGCSGSVRAASVVAGSLPTGVSGFVNARAPRRRARRRGACGRKPRGVGATLTTSRPTVFSAAV